MAVFTTLEKSDIEVLIQPYDIGQLVSFQAIGQGMENSNYLIQCEHDNRQSRYVLSLLEELSAQQAMFHVELLDKLAQSPVPVAHIVRDKQQQAVQSFDNKPVVISSFVEGSHITSMASLKQCTAIGEALADLHLSASFVRESYHGTRDNAWLEQCVYQASSLLNNQDKALVGGLLEQYLSIQQQELPHGMIHGDLFRDNAFFIGDKLTGIIDFYSAGIGFLIYDLAIVVNDWCRTAENKISQEHYFAVLNAYRNQRPWTDNEVLCWPLMMQVAAMRFWLSRLLTQEQLKERQALIQIKNPEDFKQLLVWLLTQDGSAKAVAG